MSGVYGRKIKMTIFGESHGASIGLVIDGLPPGLGIDIDFIKRRDGKAGSGPQSAFDPASGKRRFFDPEWCF